MATAAAHCFCIHAGQIHANDGEQLADAVVQIASEAAALGVLRVQETGGEVAQLLIGDAKLEGALPDDGFHFVMSGIELCLGAPGAFADEDDHSGENEEAGHAEKVIRPGDGKAVDGRQKPVRDAQNHNQGGENRRADAAEPRAENDREPHGVVGIAQSEKGNQKLPEVQGHSRSDYGERVAAASVAKQGCSGEAKQEGSLEVSDLSKLDVSTGWVSAGFRPEHVDVSVPGCVKVTMIFAGAWGEVLRPAGENAGLRQFFGRLGCAPEENRKSRPTCKDCVCGHPGLQKHLRVGRYLPV